jgi:hypothetical protein
VTQLLGDAEKVLTAEWAMLAVVDTGPLYAAVDSDDADHARCRAVLEVQGSGARCH